jgi:hypothetical protein
MGGSVEVLGIDLVGGLSISIEIVWASVLGCSQRLWLSWLGWYTRRK